MKTAIYIRVSTEEQVKEGYSISAQTQRLKAFCISQNWEVENLYIDEGISAKNMERPALRRMLKGIEQGKIECVLVYRLDRLTRSVFDLYKMLEVFDKHNCKFKSATEVYDTTSAMGRMFITIVAALAQWERENMGERYSMGYAEKARQGKYPRNVAPIGYDIDKDTYVLQINPREAKTVKNIYELYRQYGMVELSRIMNDRKEFTKESNRWSNTTIRIVLTNPIYKGDIYWNGQTYKGLHEPIIEEDYWNETQAILKRRRKQPARTVSSDYIFAGKLKCPSCGRPMVGYYATSNYKGKKSVYYQYRCRRKKEGTCSGTQSVSELQLEKAFLEYLESKSFVDFLDEIATTGEKELNQQPDIINVEEIKKELESVEKRKKKWQYAWTEDLITDEDFKKRMQEANEEEKSLLSQLEVDETTEELPIHKEDIINALKDIEDSWHMLKRIEKKELVQFIIKEIHYHHLSPGKGHITIDSIEFGVY